MSTVVTDQIVPPGTWELDPVHSSLGFSVKHMTVDTFTGSFGSYDVAIDGAEPKLTGTVQVDSIVTQDENLNAHLLSPEFFDADRHPELRFESTGIRREGDRLLVDGELTLKGSSQRVELAGTISGPVTDPYGRERLGLDLEAAIDRTAFGLDWNAELPSGDPVLDDTVTLSARVALVRA